jgi:hypothetical protein
LEAGALASETDILRPCETSLRLGGSQEAVNNEANRGLRLTSIFVFLLTSIDLWMMLRSTHSHSTWQEMFGLAMKRALLSLLTHRLQRYRNKRQERHRRLIKRCVEVEHLARACHSRQMSYSSILFRGA